MVYWLSLEVLSLREILVMWKVNFLVLFYDFIGRKNLVV